ncbi:MAG: hypothetical protein OEM49_09315, partial [Myxococcales bacterium]|nr:hypothetical protein [Myxococcales bacterium]
RLVYEPEQIRAIAETDLADLGLDPKLVERALDAAKGKISSAKFSGRKPVIEARDEESLATGVMREKASALLDRTVRAAAGPAERRSGARPPGARRW